MMRLSGTSMAGPFVVGAMLPFINYTVSGLVGTIEGTSLDDNPTFGASKPLDLVGMITQFRANVRPAYQPTAIWISFCWFVFVWVGPSMALLCWTVLWIAAWAWGCVEEPLVRVLSSQRCAPARSQGEAKGVDDKV